MGPYLRVLVAQVRNRLFPMTLSRALFLALFGSAGVFFVVGDYLFFLRVFHVLLRHNPNIPRFLLVGVCAKLMGLVLLTTFTMVLFSASVSALSYLYLDDDLALLLAMPFARWKLWLLRGYQTAANAGYMVFLLLFPVLVAYFVQDGGGIAACLLGLAGLVLYLAVPISWGICVTVLLARFFPARRLHQLLTVMTLVMVCLLVILLRLSRPEALLNPRSSQQSVEILKSIELPRESSLPSTWLARAVVRGSEGGIAVMAVPMGKLAALAGGSLLLLLLALRLWHSRGYGRAQERQDMAPGGGRARLVPALAWGLCLLAPAGRRARALLRRDLLLFARDPTQWGQLFILAALVVIYLANVRYMPAEIAPFRIAVSYWNLATLGLIVASVAGRFAFTAVGSEGPAYFASRLLPLGAGSYVWAKFLFTAVPLTALSVFTLFFSNRYLGVEGAALNFAIFLAVCASLSLSALALACGCAAPVFDARNPAKAVMSAWGLIYMALSMAYVAALLVANARPVYAYYTMLLSGGDPPNYLTPALSVGIGSLTLLVLSLSYAWRRLRTLEG